jgi:putative transposase
MYFETNAIYHVYNRSNETIFLNKENYIFFLNKLQTLIYPVSNILAWVIMPNHFHLLIEGNDKSCQNALEKHRPELQVLSKNIGTVLSSYTQAFNKQNNRRGNLFAHKTKAKILNEAYYPPGGQNPLADSQIDYVTACFLYIHQNPVMAGLVMELKEWEFSSFRDYAGLRKGKLVKKDIANKIIELDFDNFQEQSNIIVNENLLKKIH